MTVTGDSGGAVPPTANNIFLVGGSSTANNTTGITVVGNAGTSTETFTLTNRIYNALTTSDLILHNLTSFPLGAVPGTYIFSVNIGAYNTTTPLSAGYVLNVVVRTTGAAGSIIFTPDQYSAEEGAMTGVAVGTVIVGNNFVIEVTGYAVVGVNQVIDWAALTTYTFVS